MARAMQLQGSSCLLAAAVFLSLAQPALPERVLGQGSVLLEGAQLVEDLLGPRGASSARAELAGFVKAGAVALLAALVGGAGYIETRANTHASPDAAEKTSADTNDVATDTDEETVSPPESLPGDDNCEDDIQGEYAGFMDGMYEDVFDNLSASDLVSGPAIAKVPIPARADLGDQADDILLAAAPYESEQEEASDCPVTGALQELLAKIPRVADADGESEPLEFERQQEEQLETALAREYIQTMGEDYSAVVDSEYLGLAAEMERGGPLASA